MVIGTLPTEWKSAVDALKRPLHGPLQWRLAVLFLGMLFARGRRTDMSARRQRGLSMSEVQSQYGDLFSHLNCAYWRNRNCIFLGRKLRAGKERRTITHPSGKAVREIYVHSAADLEVIAEKIHDLSGEWFHPRTGIAYLTVSDFAKRLDVTPTCVQKHSRPPSRAWPAD